MIISITLLISRIDVVANFPKYKDKMWNDFEELLHVFLPSIDISELILLPNILIRNGIIMQLITSLNGRSIYRAQFQDDKYDKILYKEKFTLRKELEISNI